VIFYSLRSFQEWYKNYISEKKEKNISLSLVPDVLNILSIDYGLKRTGLAFCQAKYQIVFPLTILTKLGSKDNCQYLQYLIEQIKNIIVEKSITIVVIGYPMTLDFQEHSICHDIKHLAVELYSIFPNLHIILMDERFSTTLGNKKIEHILNIRSGRYSGDIMKKNIRSKNLDNRRKIKFIRKKQDTPDDIRAAMILLQDLLSTMSLCREI
jgi:RNase H-fold protein (predicted Holliday junction resolvase)